MLCSILPEKIQRQQIIHLRLLGVFDVPLKSNESLVQYQLHIEKIERFSGKSCRSLFASIQDLPWAILLDTSDSRLSNSRFDVITYDPIAALSYKNKASEVISRHAEYQRNLALDCPFAQLQQWHQKFCSDVNFQLSPSLQALPFLVGLAGLFGYDLNMQLDQISDSGSDEYDTADLALGLYSASLIHDNHTATWYYCHVPELTDNNWLIPFDTRLPKLANFSLLSDWQSNMTESDYLHHLASIDNYLRAGDCYQINVAQRFSAQYEGAEWQAYIALANANQAPFSSFIRLPTSCVISVSPERFISVKDGEVETKPIKGTAARDRDPVKDQAAAEELLASEKNRAENLMIVDLLRNDLSKHCMIHSVQVPSLFALESYPAVHHLVSTISAKLSPDTHPLDLLKGAFPGGSITGAPKRRAMQIIQDLEPNKRNVYCGSIGYIGLRNDMDTNICIRTILAENNTLYCWAGGGIVLDSNAPDEFQESLDKVQKILPVLAKHASE